LEDRLAWTEEGTYPVAPGVHRIPLPLPSDALRAVNVYAIEAAGGLVLIDSGWALANALDQLERSLARIGAGLPDVRKFLVTHLHRDHYTQAIQVRRLLGTPVALGAEEKHSIDRLLSGEYRPLGAQLAQLRAAGADKVIDELATLERPDWVARAEVARAETVRGEAELKPGAGFAAAIGYEAPDEWIAAGQEFDLGTRTLTAVPTPGHTRGHVVFTDMGEGLLFAGDHVLPRITPSIGFEEAPSAQPLGDYLRSLSVIRQMPDLRLLPAHGPVTASAHARVDELVQHHAGRLQAMTDVLAGGAATGYEVALAIPWTSRQRSLTELDPMNEMLAVGETVYHLDLLVAQSVAASHTGEDGVRRYRLAEPAVPPTPPAPPQPDQETAV
jgi:glyoxylase-like metal-dependent hydrolase (beta-lactamase superfamily II)